MSNFMAGMTKLVGAAVVGGSVALGGYFIFKKATMVTEYFSSMTDVI